MQIKHPTRTLVFAAIAVALVAAAVPKLVKTLIPLPLKQIIPAGQRQCSAKPSPALVSLMVSLTGCPAHRFRPKLPYAFLELCD